MRLIHALAATAVTGSLLLLAAPASQAATPAACTTYNPSNPSLGYGQVTLCPQSNGSVQATGYVVITEPYNAWLSPECVGLWVNEGSTNGTLLEPIVCAVSSAPTARATINENFTPAAPVTGVKVSPVTI
ncbi:hypothetical protein ACFYNO_13630 [Kitasatospora sp. NPDC006697]|uniref:hypothetical protein n=1 Tax=Kitasatospora sp. NPDC006697 TaxID=3364020 RepID=UPI0036AD6B83